MFFTVVKLQPSLLKWSKYPFKHWHFNQVHGKMYGTSPSYLCPLLSSVKISKTFLHTKPETER